MAEKYITFNGIKFCRDNKTGYYLNSTMRKRLHRYVWEYYKGEIPKRYHVHHRDGNKNNNDISNLELLTPGEHLFFHGKEEKNIKKMQERVQPIGTTRAIEWHRTPEGKKWHEEHYLNNKDRLHKKINKKCEHCGGTFKGLKRSRFCSNKCKSRWRRESGLDDVKRTCANCGENFTINKYSKNKYCSKACSNKAEPRLPQIREKKSKRP